jgi:hypothetical protein
MSSPVTKPASFVGSWLKINRARKHIDELEDLRTQFLGSSYHSVFVETDPQTGQSVLSVAVVGHLPDDTAVIIGDAIHNLRSALDHMAYQLVSEAGVTPSRTLAFPFAKTRADLDGALKGEISVVGASILDIIRNTIKPYADPDGNPILYSLTALDNQDKHKLLIPTITVAMVTGLCAFDEVNNIGMIDETVMFAGSGQMPVFGAPGNLKIENPGKAYGEIVFDKASIFAGLSVVGKLRELTKLVEAAVSAVEAARVIKT